MQFKNKIKEISEISIENLILWKNNPRINSVKTEKDAILQIFQKDPNGMFNLIKDICENGLLSANNLLVSPETDGKFLVIEGNRRVSAIKCILDPSILEETNLASYSKKISKLNKEKIDLFKTKIKCSVDTKESQLMQLEKIHNGEMNGIGRKKWGSFEKDKFMLTIKNKPQNAKVSTLLLAYIKKNPYILNEKTIFYINSISPTNIDRLLGSSVIKKHLGLHNYLTINTYQFDQICKLLLYFYNTGNKVELIYRKENILKFLADYIDNGNDDIIITKNADQIIHLQKAFPVITSGTTTKINNLVNSIIPESPAPEYVAKKETHSGQIMLPQTKELLNTETNVNKTKRSLKPNIFFDALTWSTLKSTNPKENGIIILCSELKKLSKSKDYIKYPTATSIIMRALLEQTIIFYACKNRASSSLYNRIIKPSKAHQPERFKPLDAILNECIKDASEIKDKKSIFYNNDVLARTFKSFAQVPGTKNFFDMVIHNPSHVKANSLSLEAIAQQGFFSFINEILNS